MIRKLVTKDTRSGVALPYYREYGISDPKGIQYIEGQNYGEHQLFALRTRLESDPLYADLATEEGTRICFRKYPDTFNIGDKKIQGMRVYLQIVTVDVDTAKTYYLEPDWLKERVDYWLNKHQDYFVILSDQYPVSSTIDIPVWWSHEILDHVNMSYLYKDVYEPVDREDLSRIKNYDYFTENGTLFMRLIDDNSPYNIGELTPRESLSTGERNYRRNYAQYGDLKFYSQRYYDLQFKLIEFLEGLYIRGSLVLDHDSPLIKNWDMVELSHHDGIYTVSWSDARLGVYDGITQMLSRQLPSSIQNWDYQLLYYYLGDNPVLLHDTVAVIPQVSYILGDVLMVRVDNISDAISYADAISELKSYSYGTVKIETKRSPNSYGYYDLLRSRVMYIHRVEDEVFKLPQLIEIPTKTIIPIDMSEALGNIQDLLSSYRYRPEVKDDFGQYAPEVSKSYSPPVA